MANKKLSIKPKKRFNIVQLLVLFLVSVFILTGQSAYWVRHNFFDAKVFSNTLTYGLTQESSRQAIGNEVSDQVLKNNPIIKRVAGDKLSDIVSTLLGTQLADSTIRSTTLQLNKYMTSSHQEPIAIDLTDLKTAISVVSKVTQATGNDLPINESAIPNQLVLLQPGTVPSLYKSNIILSILAPLLLLISGLALGALFYFQKKNLGQIVRTCGLLLTITALVGIAVGPVLKPPFIAAINSANLRGLLGNIYDLFWSPFYRQMLVMLYAGVSLVAVSYLAVLSKKLSNLYKVTTTK